MEKSGDFLIDKFLRYVTLILVVLYFKDRIGKGIYGVIR